ncbi:carbonic anhydrase [Hirschia baltica]|uniref:Carbonic anhydrase n=1 Tax=Hirschia baltica (strain ATCC 49814 / DSM 5838 / IFAM 1418) TaxID=582402 RepID=C6XRS7_HIRBI|nr:carbonic anhydrase [Hirschia baltica]ACT60687.1 Carbonate dehydratase [Hirschia baltica ATCC 49814]
MCAARTAEQDRLLTGYRRFRNGRYQETSQIYKDLGSYQDPDIMIISCADSRADPALIFDAVPGEFFIVRNVAALVPPYDDRPGGYHGVSAAVEFAVTALKVKQILVMGHAGCGGVKASLSAAKDKPVGTFIAPWVEIANEARDKVLACEHNDTPEKRELALEHGVVGQSIKNLQTFPFVTKAMEEGELVLEGAWFSIAEGKLLWRNWSTGEFFEVDANA